MALFTDGPICTIEDLAAQDSGVLDVAGMEAIDLTSKLRLSQDEIGVELAPLLPCSGLLGNIVSTAPLRLWHGFRTLELVYRDAYHNQLNDRYRGKRDEYHALAEWAGEKLMATGVGIVANPVRKADSPELSTVYGSGAANTYFVTVSWVGANGDEGAPADWKAISTAQNSALSVKPVNRPSNAAGWNVFVGLAPDAISLQNESPLDPEQGWVQLSAIQTGGRQPGSGQVPDYYRRLPRVLQRG